jgi:lipoprotein-releasing system permease protein
MLSLKIAFRFLKYGKIQTILIIAGIAVAVAIQLYVGLIIDSLQKTIVQRTLGNSPHITITSATDVTTLRDWVNIVSRVEANRLVRVVSVTASGSGLADKKNTTQPVIIQGFNYANADGIYHLSKALYAGRAYTSGGEAIIGKELAEKLNLKVGDQLTVSIPGADNAIFYVTGLYDLGVAAINRSWVITQFETGQRLFNYGNRATSIEITVGDVFQADTVASVLRKDINKPEIKIEDWKGQNGALLSGLMGQQISGLLIQIFVIVSVVIAISSVLAITVFQKSRQIGILKAMGIKDFSASLIFVIEGFLLGLAGSVLGVSFGLALTYGFAYFTTPMSGLAPIDLYVDYGFVFNSWLISLAAASLAGIIPARRSLRLNPVDVIREG